ncbi:hypothetical protein [Oceaniglobus roseus]|uniref:hypothetical protein n=1 Tax=Oceaniglobus roseus TaxID=1737570 RepID=UPI00130014EC|nr:hypothetical protein [Kandeliimicrobium roseum]
MRHISSFRRSSVIPAVVAASLALLAGCDSPSVAFSGVPAQRITVGPSTFSVRVRGERAESLRVSREFRPSESAVLARAAQAIEQASGCAIARGGLEGDQAIQRAKLDCG